MEPRDNPWPRRIARLALVLAIAGMAYLAHRRIVSAPIPALEPGDKRLPVAVYHLTSVASRDAQHPLKSWASTAAAHGVDFVVVTDLAEQLAGPVEYDGVTVVTAAELSTPFGRVVQLGADGVVEAQGRQRIDVLGAIRSLNGFPIISHPGDPKLPWNGPLTDVGGIEIAGYRSSMRRTAGRLFFGAVPALIAARIRPRFAMAQLYDRDERALARWDEEGSSLLTGICGADSTGLLSPEQNLSTWRLVLESPLDESDANDGYQLVDRIRQGRFFCAAGVFGARPYFRFGALEGDSWVGRAGDSLSSDDASTLVVFGPRGTPQDPTLVLLRNGAMVARITGRELRYENPIPGTYRAEVRVSVPGVFFGERMVTAIYSNRIHLRASDAPLD